MHLVRVCLRRLQLDGLLPWGLLLSRLRGRPVPPGVEALALVVARAFALALAALVLQYPSAQPDEQIIKTYTRTHMHAVSSSGIATAFGPTTDRQTNTNNKRAHLPSLAKADVSM